MKDNGRRDHTLNSTPRGPTNGVQFNSKKRLSGTNGLQVDRLVRRQL